MIRRALGAVAIGAWIIAAAIIATAINVWNARSQPPQPAPPAACELPELRAACDVTCAPLRARWTAAVDGTTVILKCGCEEPPNVGVHPLKKKGKRG